MSTTLLQFKRRALQRIEIYEKLAADLLAESKIVKDDKHVLREHMVKEAIKQVQEASAEVLEIQEELEIMLEDLPSVNELAEEFQNEWSSLQKYNSTYETRYDGGFNEEIAMQYLREVVGDEDSSKLFSSMECNGRAVDMQRHFHQYLELRDLVEYRKICAALQYIHKSDRSFRRQKKKKDTQVTDENDDAETIDPYEKYRSEQVKFAFSELGFSPQLANKVARHMQQNPDITYSAWLKSFHELSQIPRYFKYNRKDYKQYLENLLNYLTEFFVNAQPLVDHERLNREAEEQFIKIWNDKEQLKSELPQWILATSDIPGFGNDKLQYPGVEDSSLEPIFSDEPSITAEKDKELARLEFLIKKYRLYLIDQINEAVNEMHLLQSRNVDEVAVDTLVSQEEADVIISSESEDEIPLNNPRNLPLGFDGKPIPFWLYRLHGMGVEYKCEICGDHSYWGSREFEQHFGEMKHCQGLRALGITLVSKFRGITKIEDAMRLREKLLDDSLNVHNVVEYEDEAGHLVRR